MIEDITEPLAYALVSWVPAEGGRRSGPPIAPVYVATCVFPLGGEAEVHPGWPGTAEQLSILVQQVEIEPDGRHLCKLDFLARDLARPFLMPDAELLILEGPKVVATAHRSGRCLEFRRGLIGRSGDRASRSSETLTLLTLEERGLRGRWSHAPGGGLNVSQNAWK